MTVDAIGIFAGGGAKGFAHVGAFSESRDRGIKFKFVAGTSAGSIVAALVAAGYSPDEIYNPNDNSGVLTTDFIVKLGCFRWTGLRAFAKGWHLLYSFWLWPFVLYVILVLLVKKGVFDSADLEPVFEEWLSKKITPINGGAITFRDMPTLKIVGTSLGTKGALVWSRSDTPDFSVAKAIATSISIPFVFRPVEIDFSVVFGSKKRLNYKVNDLAVDGGMVSNFPIWVFDEERGQDWDISTFAFCFNSKVNGEFRSWKSYIWRLISVAISGDQILETRQVDNLFLVPLDVSLGTLDFDATDSQRKLLYVEGRKCVDEAFENLICPQNHEVVSGFLKILCDQLISRLKDEGVHANFRANVMLRGPRNTLRVMYSYNMNEHADDRLALKLGTGVCGLAMNTVKPVVIDLLTDQLYVGESRWGLSKYQSAMLWKDLRTIFSIPMVRLASNGMSEVVGVLNFDSAAPIKKNLEKFFQDGVDAANGMLALLFHLKVDSKEAVYVKQDD